jgi:Spy/CpxP family protein refolding chaperone
MDLSLDDIARSLDALNFAFFSPQTTSEFYLGAKIMSPFTLFSGLMASACLAWAIPTTAMAQTPGSMAEGLLLAQSETPDVLTELEAQPQTPDDLLINTLTDEQITAITAIFDEYQPQIDAATADYLEFLGLLNNLLSPGIDNLAITDARNDVVAAKQQIDDLVFQQNMAIRSVLNQEQRAVINDFVRAWLDIGPATPVAVFPMNLIGQDISTVLPELQADGWEDVVRTPNLVELNRGSEELNLDLRRGEVISAEFLD